MIDLLRWALQRQERSKDTARHRLQLILVMDRVGLAKEHMEAMKSDIIEAVSKYMLVDHESIEMDMKRSGESLILVSNIQIKGIIRAAAVEQPQLGT